jgi:hypothetical protein
MPNRQQTDRRQPADRFTKHRPTDLELLHQFRLAWQTVPGSEIPLHDQPPQCLCHGLYTGGTFRQVNRSDHNLAP